MEYIKGVTFASCAHKGVLGRKEARQSLLNLVERTNADFIILVPNGIQDTPQSETIDYTSEATMTDEELVDFITYAKGLGLRVAIKPIISCRNGIWHAYVSFFEEDVPCEPKWSNWFLAYTQFVVHYAKLAQESGCEMFLAGCELVQSEHREEEWRKVIAEIRRVYHGLVSYDTDKYQEHNVKWWDAVDVISSSGYYPINDWKRQLDRIEAVVKKFQKPFFFSECGCLSTVGSKLIPNDWRVTGKVDLEGQADWYRAMFEACEERNWCQGFAITDWAWKQYQPSKAKEHKGYDIYCKPAEKVVAEFYQRN